LQKLIFSKPPQELPLVALGQQEKISFCGTRLFAAIGAGRLCFKTKISEQSRFED